LLFLFNVVRRYLLARSTAGALQDLHPLVDVTLGKIPQAVQASAA